MRRNLSISNDEIALQAELDLIRHYLEIQQFRFGDKVSFNFDIQCDISQYMILPLLLQPLVENAFVHGLEGKIGQGHIEITVIKEAMGLFISVKDNGLGILPEKLVDMREKLASDSQSMDGSIGLTNVNQRLKIYYGNESRFDIVSEENIGTEVHLLIPFLEGGRADV